MKRVLAIWLPNWAVQRLVLSRPELAGRALVLHGPSRRGECVAACSQAAQRLGVEAGIPVAEAVALLSLPRCSGSLSPSDSPRGRWQRAHAIEPHEPEADRAALIELARWCHRFSPSVGLEDAELPEMLLADATNLAPLFGGETEYVAQIAGGFQRRGLDARLALADTVGAAWALARFGQDLSHLEAAPAGQAAALRPDASAYPGVTGAARAEPVLAPLPLAALRLPNELLDTLAHLGVGCVGDALELPREQLRSRFGPRLLERLDQLTGAAAEVIVAVEPPEEFVVEQAFDYPITHTEAIRLSIERLLERLAWLMTARNAGALAVACRLECEGAPAVQFEFGLFQPTANARQLLELAELKLERVQLPAPAAAIELRVVQQAPLEQRQAVMFDEERGLDHSRPLASLVNRLAGRLGAAAVVRCRLVNDAQPELAYRDEPLVSGAPRLRTSSAKVRSPKRLKARGSLKASSRVGQMDRGPLDRPLCLLARPEALATTISVVPEGPPKVFHCGRERHDVVRHWGPERIATGWWRRERAVRDYYRVETTEGRRFWLFRRLKDGQWFLHAAYQ